MDPQQLFSISGKTALVTGGTRGIGEMIVRAYVAAGTTVYVSSRKAEACEAIADALSAQGTCIGLPADLSTPEGCAALIAEVQERVGSLDVLVNNAGATWGAPLAEYPVEGFDKVMNLNVRAPFLMTQGLVPQLAAAASGEDPARVINIGSIAGLRTPTNDAYAYGASKAAVHHLTRHLAAALAEQHINVNAIAPGLFPSRMTAHMLDDEEDRAALGATILRGRVGEPEDIAAMAIHLAARAGAWITGAVMSVDGGGRDFQR